MKILHTADWHIGKKLHAYDLAEDFEQFINWLSHCLTQNQIDVLLISGDVFDLANPSSASRNQYYESLVTLRKYVNHIIITGGNHDSPSMLNAPQKLLTALNIDVIGGLPKDIGKAVIPLKNNDNEVEVVVAAIPFLRQGDIRKSGEILRTYEARVKALQDGIVSVFDDAAGYCQKHYPDVPAIAMGHLYAAGIEESDSERDIQIGNQAAVKASAFNPHFQYVALGHIHKPQRVSAEKPVFYSGSPLPLSFSERKDQKRVLLIDTEKSFEPESVDVPVFRSLLKISGNISTIRKKLNHLPKPEFPLKNLIEIELEEEVYQTKHLQDLEYIVSEFENPSYQIVKHRAIFRSQLKGLNSSFDEHISLNELKPKSVFAERLNREDYTSEERKELEFAFAELLEELESEEG